MVSFGPHPPPNFSTKFTGLEDAPDILRAEMSGLKHRAAMTARSAGSFGPLEYVGAGMTSVTFTDGRLAFKVFRTGRHGTPHTEAQRRFQRGREDDFRREADYLAAAARGRTFLRRHVAGYLGRDDETLTIVREMVPGRPGGWGSRGLREVWERIVAEMGPTWGPPEFKEDSFVLAKRPGKADPVWVLVDAGPAFRRGINLLGDTVQKLASDEPLDAIELRDLAWELRMEVADGRLSDKQARGALEELYRRGAPRD